MSLQAVPTNKQLRPHQQPHKVDKGKASADANALYKALKGGFFTDGDGVFSILCKRTAAQIHDIREAYQHELKRDLLDDVKSNTSGHFEDVLKGLVMGPAEYDAYRIHRAVAGLGTDEDQLIEIVAQREPHEVRAYNDAYQKLFGKTAHAAIKDDVSGELGELMSKLSDPKNERKDPSNMDAQLQIDCLELFHASQDKTIGHDVKPFIRVLGDSSRFYVNKVYAYYANKHGKTLELIIGGWSFQGALERTLLAIVTPPAEFYSKLLYKAMKGVVGTNDNQLIRIIVTQRERYLPDIAAHFLHEHKKALKVYVKDETSGDYEKALVAILEFYAEAI